MKGILTALSDPTRRAALAIIWRGGEHYVCELMVELDATPSRASRHMRVFRQADLVLDRVDAQWVRYRRHPGISPEVASVVDAIFSAEQKAPLEAPLEVS